ncbi:hypothetical protein [Microbulbifer sp. JMSA003]|uniref:hypothetical protein n=1 Tax=Microbulbifer sp. JMSA003 TaxID=3243369 RepID=UPI0040393C1A
MKTLVPLVIVVSSLSFYGCSSATSGVENTVDDSNALSSVDSTQQGQAEDELICKTKRATGSRFKKKTCMTKEEWRKESEKASKYVRENR